MENVNEEHRDRIDKYLTQGVRTRHYKEGRKEATAKARKTSCIDELRRIGVKLFALSTRRKMLHFFEAARVVLSTQCTRSALQDRRQCSLLAL